MEIAASSTLLSAGLVGAVAVDCEGADPVEVVVEVVGATLGAVPVVCAGANDDGVVRVDAVLWVVLWVVLVGVVVVVRVGVVVVVVASAVVAGDAVAKTGIAVVTVGLLVRRVAALGEVAVGAAVVATRVVVLDSMPALEFGGSVMSGTREAAVAPVPGSSPDDRLRSRSTWIPSSVASLAPSAPEVGVAPPPHAASKTQIIRMPNGWMGFERRGGRAAGSRDSGTKGSW